MSIYSVGISGLNAAQSGLLTASHNISNASTTGYSRQRIVQGTNIPMLSGSGFVGQGTNVTTVKRIYDDFLGRQVLSAESGASEMDTYLAQITQIDNLLADSSAGLSPALAGFFQGVQDVAANPASIPGRQSMLSAAQSLVARFQSLDQRMSEIRDGTNTQIMGQVTQINTYATQIADINQRIILAQSGSLTQVPNDMLDQRDQMLRDLNKLVKVSTLTQGDGAFNVFIGSGQPLVVGTQAYQLKAVAAADDPERIVVAMEGVGGTTLNLPESQITGGTLGGLVAFRSQTLDAAQNGLGRIALTLAQNFNDQQKLGMDLTGAQGVDFFDVSNVQPKVGANAANTGNGLPSVSFDAANIDQLTTSDYRLTYVGGGTPYQLTRLADNTVTNYASLPSVDGMTMGVGTWSPNLGDSVLIQPTRAGAGNIAVAFSDPRLIAAAAPIRTATPLSNTGTASVSAGTVDKVVFPAALDPNLTATVTITFDNPPGTFHVNGTGTGDPVGVGYVSGDSISYNGWTIQISGTPAAGDVFTVSENLNGVADNRNAMLLGALQTATTMVGSSATDATASYQSAYSQIVSQVGRKANEVTAIGAAQQSLADHANTALKELSGVNLDEEAADLLRYQQAYQAAAKILATASKVFDEILSLGA